MKKQHLFWNLEKTKVVQGTVKKLETENEEINNPINGNKELTLFFKILFKTSIDKTL